jgi:predicted amidohydrolase YtcJ
MINNPRYIFFFGLLFSSFIQIKGFAQKADIILFNGKIFTSDTSNLIVEALAIKGNKILFTGKNSDVEKFAATGTKKIDLKGKTVVPGFNDAHDHLGWFAPVGKNFYHSFSIPGPNKKEILDTLSSLLKDAKPGQWVQAQIGLDVFHDVSVRRKLLDSIAPDNPVVLQVMWGHGMVVNSKTLQAANISDGAADPLGGIFEREPGSNRLTGAIYEYGQYLIWQARTVSEPNILIKYLRDYATEEIKYGITTVQNMSSTLQGDAARRIFSEAELPLRVRIIPMPATNVHGRGLAEWQNKTTQLTALCYVSGIKYVMDGTPLEETACMTKPYPDKKDWYGRLNFPIDTIKQILREALDSKTQLCMHMVGDSTTKVILKLMKEAAPDSVWRKKRVRIEHGDGITTEEVIQEVDDMGITVAHTPQYDFYNHLRSLIAKGITITFAPDGLTNPFQNILIVTTQQHDPAENITREQAVIAYTRNAAYAEFADDKKGTLAPGKLADLVVLSQDVFTVPVEQLVAIHSILTIIDGKVVYQN